MDTKAKLDVAAKAIEVLTPIPSEEWIIGAFRDLARGKYCAVGHYSRIIGKGYDPLITAAGKIDGLGIISANDGDHPKYQQATAKERSLAYLADRKKELEKELEYENQI